MFPLRVAQSSLHIRSFPDLGGRREAHAASGWKRCPQDRFAEPWFVRCRRWRRPSHTRHRSPQTHDGIHGFVPLQGGSDQSVDTMHFLNEDLSGYDE